MLQTALLYACVLQAVKLSTLDTDICAYAQLGHESADEHCMMHHALHM